MAFKIISLWNIFANDQIGSFSYLVIITLMSNRLNKVENVLYWKVHFGNKENLSSILIMHLCYTPWQLTSLGAELVQPVEKEAEKLKTSWNTTKHSLASSHIPCLPYQNQYFIPYSNQDNGRKLYAVCS